MAGHEVICVSRQEREPYNLHPTWRWVEQVKIDRAAAEEKGDFGQQIKALGGEIVIDLICFELESAQMLVESLAGEVEHFLHCGTVWIHGHAEQVPTLETQARRPFDSYGIKKAEIEAYLLSMSRQRNFPVTLLHPGHITGPGWLPINPAGHLDPEVFVKLAKGQEVILPNMGMETVHHVHADDVAQAFMKAIECRQSAMGESFHVVSEQALTLRGFAMAMARWFGQEANLSFLPWEEWKETVSARDAELTWDHIAHSPNASIAKAKKILGYNPRYSALQAVQEAVGHYFDKENMSFTQK
jgi:nucleoside-diphosphate-sugar epimerase